MILFYSTLKKLLLFIGLLLSVFFSVLMLRELADRYFRWITNNYYLIDLTVLTLTMALFTYIVIKQRYSITSSLAGISLISYSAAAALGVYFGNSDLWYLKYVTGVLTGIFFFLILSKNTGWKSGMASVTIALIATGIAEMAEYISVLDPPENPSLLYNLSAFSKVQIVLTLLIVVLPAYIISQGSLIKRLFTK